MEKHAKICVAYTGPAVDDGTMDINELAPALLALSNLIGTTNRILNNDNSTVEVRLSAHLERGSFEMSFELIHTFSEQIKRLFIDSDYSLNSILGALGLVSTISGINLLEIYRWIKGRKISKIEETDNNTVRVFIENESREISVGTWNIFRSQKIHQHMEGVMAPLKHDGVESFEVRDADNKEVVEKVSSTEAVYFDKSSFEEPIEEISSAQSIVLKIVSVNFERGLKWRFDDGDTKFYADVQDKKFIEEVENGNISFSKGDAILAEVKITQQVTKDELKKSEKTITKVFNVIKRPKQYTIFENGEEDTY